MKHDGSIHLEGLDRVSNYQRLHLMIKQLGFKEGVDFMTEEIDGKVVVKNFLGQTTTEGIQQRFEAEVDKIFGAYLANT